MKVLIGLLALTLCTVACDRRETTPTEAEDTVTATGATGATGTAAGTTNDPYQDTPYQAAQDNTDPQGTTDMQGNNPATESARDGANDTVNRDGTMRDGTANDLNGDGTLRSGATGSDTSDDDTNRDEDRTRLQRTNGTSPATAPTPVP